MAGSSASVVRRPGKPNWPEARDGAHNATSPSRGASLGCARTPVHLGHHVSKSAPFASFHPPENTFAFGTLPSIHRYLHHAQSTPFDCALGRLLFLAKSSRLNIQPSVCPCPCLCPLPIIAPVLIVVSPLPHGCFTVVSPAQALLRPSCQKAWTWSSPCRHI